ncbi:MAG: arylsulfatase [Verrucomicrobiae bacterium]|nr:arylsulfatase [Verrucomicrobiae bacterium]
MIPCSRFLFRALLFISGLSICAILVAGKDQKRPNIIVILTDDMGYSDIGCFGSEIATPNIDRLSEDGIRFTQFYNCARCNPTRAALLTGRNPHEAGMGFSTGDLGSPAYQGHISRNSVTIAEVLGQAGYTTLMSGKWHVGDNRPEWPIDRGFQRFFGLLGGAGSYWEVLPGKGFRLALDDQLWQPYPEDTEYYFTDEISDRAVGFIEEAAKKDNPFFLYLTYTAPHWPLHAPEEDIARYRGRYRMGWDKLREIRHKRQLELGVIDSTWPLSPRDKSAPAWSSLSAEEQDRWDLLMAVYAAMIDRMDQGIGRVLRRLEELGEADNTLTLFLSDNGGCHVEPSPDQGGSDPEIGPGPRGGFWGYGPPWANVSNTPFVKFKQYIHEGGISTPLICHWPARIERPDRANNQPGHVIDIMATLMDITGIEYPTTFGGNKIQPLRGISFAPVFSDQPRKEHEVLYWEHTGHRGVRKGNWKLVSDRGGDWELYDVVSDRSEQKDLISAYPKKVQELESLYQEWAKASGVLDWDEVQERRRNKP